MSRAVRRYRLAISTGSLFCLGLSGAMGQSAPAASSGAALEIVNRAAVAITEVRLASRAMGGWGTNLLTSPVSPGQQRRVAPERQEGCLYSLRIVYNDNRFERFSVIDLCRNQEYVFAGKVAQLIANQPNYNSPPASEVTVFNRSAKTIRVIRMSPVNDRMWGPDRLGSQILAADKSYSVPLDQNKGCLYRVYAFYEDSMVEVLPSANLCVEYSVEFKRTAALTYNQLPAHMRVTPTTAIQVSNQSGFQIDWIYVFPDNQSQGPDRLAPKETLPSGRQKRIDVSDQTQCYVTVLAVYQDRREERKQGFDLCATHEPVVTMRTPSINSNRPSGAQGISSNP